MRIVASAFLALLFISTSSMADPPQDANGWTILNPSPDSRVVYVSDSTGNDNNDGLSPMSPKKTISAGVALIRDGFPDHLLLKRGDVFTDQWFGNWNFKNGRSRDELSVIGSYGSGPRPIVRPPANTRGWRTTRGCRYVAITDIHFHAHRRDPDHPNFIGVGNDEQAIHLFSFNRTENFDFFLVENCKIEKFGGGILLERTTGENTISDCRIRRNVIVDSFSNNSHSQGMYIHGIDGILLEDNVFDHNGWYGDRDTGGSIGAPATTFNHNVYVDNENPYEGDNTADQRNKIIVCGNIFARSSASGIQLRPGGTFEQNLCVQNANVKLGGGSQDNGNTSPYTPDGADVNAMHNVVLEGIDINSSDFLGYGLQLSNIRNASIHDNVVAHDKANPTNTYGVPVGKTLNQTPRLVNFQRNTFYKWRRGAIKNHASTPLNFSPEENNLYWDADSIPWVVSGSNQRSEDQSFADPERSVGSYNATLGGAPTLEAFLAEARKQSKNNWRPEYTSKAVNDYIRAGFATGPVNRPPVAVDDSLVAQKRGPNPVSINVLDNDSDPDGDVLTVFSVNDNPALVGATVAMTYGSVVIQSDGTATYTLDNENQAVKDLQEGQSLTDVVSYECSDGSLSDSANLTVTINGVNDFVVIPIPEGATHVKVEFQWGTAP